MKNIFFFDLLLLFICLVYFIQSTCRLIVGLETSRILYMLVSHEYAEVHSRIHEIIFLVIFQIDNF